MFLTFFSHGNSFTDWALVGVSLWGVITAGLVGAGTVGVAFLTLRVNQQTQQLQTLMKAQQDSERVREYRQTYETKMAEWRMHYQEISRMKYQASWSRDRHKNSRSEVEFVLIDHAGLDPSNEARLTYTLFNKGEGVAHDVYFQDVSIPRTNEWDVVSEQALPTELGNQDGIVIAARNEIPSTRGILMRITWIETDPFASDGSGMMRREMNQTLFIPPEEDLALPQWDSPLPR